MKSLLPFSLFLFFVVGSASSQTFNWARPGGTAGEEWGHAVSTDKARNSYMTGSFNSPITFPGCGTVASAGNADIFIAKFDPNGLCVWARRYGSSGVTGADEGLSITVDSVGNSYTTGYFTGTATFGSVPIVSKGQTDIFIAKHDQNGALLWVVRGGGVGLDFGYGIASGPSVYATGYVSTNAGNVTFDSTVGAPCSFPNVTMAQDVFIIRYNSNGVCQVLKRGGGTNQDAGNAISLDGGANVYVTGTFIGSATIGTTTITGSTANPNTFIAKLDPMLSLVWLKAVNGNARGQSIGTDSQGNSYIAGYFLGSATFVGTFSYTLTAGSSGDAFVARYDAAGGARWARKVGASGTASAYGISVRESCDVFVTGSFTGSTTFGGLPLVTSAGQRDIFVARYDNNGNIQWALTAGGSLEDEGRGISVDNFGNASVTGVYKSSTAIFIGASPNLTNSNTLSRNAFVAKASP